MKLAVFFIVLFSFSCAHHLDKTPFRFDLIEIFRLDLKFFFFFSLYDTGPVLKCPELEEHLAKKEAERKQIEAKLSQIVQKGPKTETEFTDYEDFYDNYENLIDVNPTSLHLDEQEMKERVTKMTSIPDIITRREFISHVVSRGIKNCENAGQNTRSNILSKIVHRLVKSWIKFSQNLSIDG